MISFDSLEPKVLSNFQGGQGDILAKISADDTHRIIKSTYAPGVSTGYHRHEGSDEILFILQGTCKVMHEGKEERLQAGDCHYCKDGESHAVINDGETDLVMFAVVTNF